MVAFNTQLTYNVGKSMAVSISTYLLRWLKHGCVHIFHPTQLARSRFRVGRKSEWAREFSRLPTLCRHQLSRAIVGPFPAPVYWENKIAQGFFQTFIEWCKKHQLVSTQKKRFRRCGFKSFISQYISNCEKFLFRQKSDDLSEMTSRKLWVFLTPS